MIASDFLLAGGVVWLLVCLIGWLVDSCREEGREADQVHQGHGRRQGMAQLVNILPYQSGFSPRKQYW
jgi:hypothetical protein